MSAVLSKQGSRPARTAGAKKNPRLLRTGGTEKRAICFRANQANQQMCSKTRSARRAFSSFRAGKMPYTNVTGSLVRAEAALREPATVLRQANYSGQTVT